MATIKVDNFTYPHTSISIDAKTRRTPIVAESDATTLLAPFACDRGPENELVAVDSFSDFQAIFGELDYSIPNQRQILNIGRWLTGGGRVLACRLTDINDNSTDNDGNLTRKAKKAGNEKYIICSNNTNTAIYNSNDFNSAIISNNATEGLVNGIYYPYTQSAIEKIIAYKLSTEAKYSGSYYNSLSIAFEAKNNNPGYFDISVVQTVGSSSITVEKFRNKTFSDFNSIETTSQYIGELMLQKVEFEPSKVASFTLDGVTHYAGSTDSNSDAVLYTTDESLRDALVARINDVYSNANPKYTVFNELMSNTEAMQGIGASVIINSETGVVSAVYKYFVARDLSDSTSAYRTGDWYYLVTKTGSGASATYGSTVTKLTGADLIENLATYVNGNENYCMIDTEPEEVTITVRYVISASGITVNDDELETPFDKDELGTPTSTKYFRSNFTVEFAGGADVDDDFIYGEDYVDSDGTTKTTSKLYTSLYNVLAKPLETPFDVMIDPGYPLTVKKQLITLFAIGEPITFTVPKESGDIPYSGKFIRDDAFLYLSAAEIYGNGRRNRTVTQLNYLPDTVLSGLVNLVGSDPHTHPNVAIIKQYKKVIDIYSAESGKEVFVPLTYDLAYLVPYNDAVYGPQWPIAGLTRGVIGTKDMWINEVPTTVEKQINYDNMFNYAEKDSRGSYIMTNLTATNANTQLKFISKSRALLKMKRQLTKIARLYLHEMNDRITKNNLQNKLDNCMADWIKNRTLSFASVEIQDYTDDATLTDEELLLTLNIKFHNTVEIITTSFTVEQ